MIPKTLQYTLSAAQEGDDVIDATYLKGQIDQYSDGFQPTQGMIFSYEGQYYLSTDPVAFDNTAMENLNQIDRSGGGVFLLGKDLPREGKELIFQEGDSISGKKGDYVYSRGFDPQGNPISQYFVRLKIFPTKLVWMMRLYLPHFLPTLRDKGQNGHLHPHMIKDRSSCTMEGIFSVKLMILIIG